MFIIDQIKHEVQRDINLQFTQRNPNYMDSIEGDVRACVFPPLVYLLRWIEYCDNPDFIH